MIQLAPILKAPVFKVAAAISAAVPVTPIVGALAARQHRGKPLAGYGRLASMLGYIVAPYHRPGVFPAGIQYAYGGRGQYLCPNDPQHYQRGEAGLYADTRLGGIPTDAELARNYQYTPVASGWVNFKEGYYPAPYIPPGWNAAGAYGPSMALRGLGEDAAPILTTTKAEADAVVAALNAHNQRVFKVTLISTAVVGLSALITALRTVRQLKRDELVFAKYAGKKL